MESIEVDEKTAAVLKKKGYKVLKKISAGSFGEVYKATSTKYGEREDTAVKVMHLEKVEKSGLSQDFLDREIKALKEVSHPNVLKVHDIFRAAGRLYIFMEFASGGTLTDKVTKAPGGHLSEKRARFWFGQCVDALKCMHMKHRMAHRDIKLDNVLLDAKGNAKLSDFGFAREFNVKGKLSQTFCGTLPYYAPEVLGKKPYNPFLYDVWSMGVMLCQMLNGVEYLPFKVDKKNRDASLKLMRQMRMKVNREVWSDLSDEVKDLIKCMFTYEPDDRPNIEAVSRFAWLQQD